MNKIKTKDKPAYIENILLWMVMFIGFATLFFFVINYASIIRVKDHLDALSDYGANTISMQGSRTDISAQLNSMAGRGLDTINTGDLVCNQIAEEIRTFQVIFNTVTTNSSYKFFDHQLSSRRVVFNQDGSGNTVTCTLSVTILN
jgi:hypothetical protein